MARGNLEAIERRRLYQDVLERITALVRSGEIQVGDSFPSERELAQRFDVSVAVVREAFRVLEHAGLVDSRQGARRCLLSSALSFGPQLIGLEKTLQEDLLETRRLFETMIVRLAAVRRTEEDLAKLKAMRSGPVVFEGHEEMRAGDMELHLVLADAAHNKVMRSVQEHINRIRVARQSIEIPVEVRLELRRAHLPLVKAIADKDPDAAAAALSAHFDLYEPFLARAKEFVIPEEDR